MRLWCRCAGRTHPTGSAASADAIVAEITKMLRAMLSARGGVDRRLLRYVVCTAGAKIRIIRFNFKKLCCKKQQVVVDLTIFHEHAESSSLHDARA